MSAGLCVDSKILYRIAWSKESSVCRGSDQDEHEAGVDGRRNEQQLLRNRISLPLCLKVLKSRAFPARSSKVNPGSLLRLWDVGILKTLKSLKSSREAFEGLRRLLPEQPRRSPGSFERTPSVLWACLRG